MGDSITDGSIISISDIIEQYNKDPQSLDEIVHEYVSISSENQNNQGNIFAVNQPKGKENCWIIKVANNLYFLIPQKKYKLNTHFLEILKNFYNYQEYSQGKTRDFELIEPAQVSWNGGKDWILQDEGHKGILDFGNQSPVNSPVDSKEESEEYLAQITDKDRQIEKLEQEKINLEAKYQVLQKQFQNLQNNTLETFKNNLKQEILDEIGARIPQQQNIDLQAFKQEIIKEIGDPIPQQPKIDLRYFKKNILNEISDLIPQQSNIDLEALKQEIFKEIGNRTTQQSNIDLKAFKQEILNEIGDCGSQNSNIDLETFKQEIINEISDRNNQQQNIDLQAFKQEIFKELSDRNNQQQNIDLDAFKQELFKELRENEQKKNNDIESSKKSIAFEDLQSLIDSYNNKSGFTSENIISIAATEDSIEKIRSGLKTPVIFTKVYNGSCWIVPDIKLQNDCFYLVPKVDLIINSRIYQTIEDIFVCQNYAKRSTNKFQLVQPAIVKLISDSEDSEDKWELVEPGKLNFS